MLRAGAIATAFGVVATAAVFFVPAVTTAQQIKPDELQPAAAITVQLPALGNSWRTKGKSPVEMMVRLPSNYSREAAHPVLVFLAGGFGSADPKSFHDLVDGKDFISVGVDYTNENGWLSGFKNAVAALTVLSNATTIDKRSVFIGGTSSGAYATSHGIKSKYGADFAGFMPMIGGVVIEPATLGRRPILWYAGEKDTKISTNSAGLSRVAAQQAAHAKLAAAGSDSTLIVEPGVGHRVVWKNLKPKFQEWIYPRLPAVQELAALEGQLAKAQTDTARIVVYRKIATCWLDRPIVKEAKQKVAKAEAAARRPRLWTDASGKFRLRAAMAGFDGTTVRLRKGDGKVIEVPFKKLSERDRKFLAARFERD